MYKTLKNLVAVMCRLF